MGCIKDFNTKYSARLKQRWKLQQVVLCVEGSVQISQEDCLQ